MQNVFDFLADKFSSAFEFLSGNRHLSEKNIQDTIVKVEETLLQADIPYSIVQAFIAEIKTEVIGKKVVKNVKPAEQFAAIVYEKLTSFLGGISKDFVLKEPALVMVVGLQGSGKTTTVAKLAHYLAKQGSTKKNILLGSVDFYRPAAIDQLEILAQKVGVDFYRAQQKSVVAAAQEIVAYAKSCKKTVIFLDTAGRLHVDNNLLQELSELKFAINPTHSILVIDAMTGQESLRVAQAFNEITNFSGAILTKIDSQTRAGAAFAFCYAIKKPILFLGVGEKIDDLELFRADRVASRMIGMGDMKTLAEKAEEKISKFEQEEAEKAFLSGRFTLQDFASQLDMMSRVGSLSQIMRYIPGAKGQSFDQGQVEKAEKELKKSRAIISSMNQKERINPSLLDKSRKLRIANGSGVKVADIDELLKQFEQMRQFAKLFKGMNKFK